MREQPARGLRTIMSMNTTPSHAPVEDYFQRPVCTEEAADLAYGKFVNQGPDAGGDFGDWRDTQAWSIAFEFREGLPID